MTIFAKSRPVIFALIPLLVLLLTTEAGLRIIHFNVVSFDKLATVAAVKYLKRKVLLFQASQLASQSQISLIKEALYTDAAVPLLNKLKQEYEDNFRQLSLNAGQVDSKLVMLYLPVYCDTPVPSACLRLRPYFRQLAEKYQVEFVDLTDYLSRYRAEEIYHLPEDPHFSRYGNQLIAARLRSQLAQFGRHRSSHHFNQRPDLLGDLKPNQNDIWIYNPRLPYRVITNSQGLRADRDIRFPKEKQRILILGDSYTFGAYLGNQDTYPDLLSRQYPEAEIINAGIAGYTITDEASLFAERAKYTEPDITILQVSENDILGLLSFNKNRFDRRRQVYTPSSEEKELLQKLPDSGHN